MKDFVKENDVILSEWFSHHLSENYIENQFSKDGIMFRGDFKAEIALIGIECHQGKRMKVGAMHL